MTDSRNPELRVVPRREEINANGHIFGGWILAQMDIAGGIAAARRANGAVATVAIESMTFVEPILLGDILSIYTEVARVGRTSMAIKIDVIATRRTDDREVLVTTGLFTFVAIGPDSRPRPVDPEPVIA